MEKDNKLIAEFMGLPTEVFNSGNLNYYFKEFNSGTWYEEHELSYNISWDWLMPVVVEIENYLADNMGRVGYFDDCNDLEARYQSVVEFIKFYNTKKEG